MLKFSEIYVMHMGFLKKKGKKKREKKKTQNIQHCSVIRWRLRQLRWLQWQCCLWPRVPAASPCSQIYCAVHSFAQVCTMNYITYTDCAYWLNFALILINKSGYRKKIQKKNLSITGIVSLLSFRISTAFTRAVIIWCNEWNGLKTSKSKPKILIRSLLQYATLR